MNQPNDSENAEERRKFSRSGSGRGRGNQVADPEKREVLLLGVKGSGKTVLLSVLGKRFESEGPLGLCLVPESGTATDDFVTEVALRLAEGRFPAATGRSERMLLRWTVRSGRRTLFSLSSMDCAGETILDAFCGAQDGDDDDVPQLDDDELYVTRPGGGEKAVAEMLREMADRAAAICLVLNPNDFPSNARRAVLDDPDQKRDFEERFKAMRRLSLAIAQNPCYAGKTLFVLLTQVGDEAIRSGLESTGDPASYVESEFPALLRSAPGARCLAVSAVNEVDESVDERTGRVVLSPAHGFTSSGLTEFLVRVGGVLSPALAGVSGAWDGLRSAERADSFVRASVRISVPDRHAAAMDRIAAARALAAQCRDFLDADPSHPDPAGRTEEEIEPAVAAAVRRFEAEKVLDSWVRRHAVAKVSGAEDASSSSPEFWRAAFSEILEEANEAAVSSGGPDAAFSSSRFWGVADPEWLRAETENAARRLLSDVGAFAAAIEAGDVAEADRLAAVCTGKWSGAPGLDDLVSRLVALKTGLRAAEEAADRAALASAAKKAARARRLNVALCSTAAAMVCAVLAFAWRSTRAQVASEAARAWEEAIFAADSGRFSDAVARAEAIGDFPLLLFKRSSVVVGEELARWRDVPADYASRVAKAVKARDDIEKIDRDLKRDFTADDRNTDKVRQFERAVAAARAAMPGPDLVNPQNVPKPGVDPARPAAALTNAVAKFLVAWRLHDAALESASRRRMERFAAEDVIRRDASNAVSRLEKRVLDFRNEFSADDRAGEAATALETVLADNRRSLDEATRAGSIDRFRAVAAAVDAAGPGETAATAEAAAARKARLAAESEARAAAIAAKDAYEKRRGEWLAEFTAADRSGAESARAEAVYGNAVKAFEDAESATSRVAAAYDESVREFGRASRSLDAALEESRSFREKRLVKEAADRRIAEEARKRRLAEEAEAERVRAEEAEKLRLAMETERRRAEEARAALVEAVSSAVSKGGVPSIPDDVPQDDRASALEAWREALLAASSVPKNAPKDADALSAAFRALEPYFAAAGISASDESSSDPLVLRARAWADAAAEKAAEASRKCALDSGARDYGWKKALECENEAGMVRGNACASFAARRKGAEAVAGLPAFFVVGATSSGNPVALPDAVKTPGKAVKAVDPATGLPVAVARFDAGTQPILRFVRHLGGDRVPGVPRLVPGTNRFAVEFGKE